MDLVQAIGAIICAFIGLVCLSAAIHILKYGPRDIAHLRRKGYGIRAYLRGQRLPWWM